MKCILAMVSSCVVLAVWTGAARAATGGMADEERDKPAVKAAPRSSGQPSGQPSGPPQRILGDQSDAKAGSAATGSRKARPRRSRAVNRKGAAARRARRGISVSGRNGPAKGAGGKAARGSQRGRRLIARQRSAAGMGGAARTQVRRRGPRRAVPGPATTPPKAPGAVAGAAGAPQAAPPPTVKQPRATITPPTPAPAGVNRRSRSATHAPLEVRSPARSMRAGPVEPAPPLDEWERYVAMISQRYGFSEEQDARAQVILTDLRGRARQYRLSRSPEYAQAEKLEDRKAREARLKQLNGPIDQAFNELKMRLENLPTIEQKLRAAEKGPRGKSKRRRG